MFTKRIIPCLDIKDGRVVKGVNFLGLRDAGDPVDVARSYEAQGADELIFLDISASHEGRAIMLDVVRHVAEEIFMPFTVGGGIRTLDDATRLIQAGAEKVSLNTSAVQTPELITEVSRKFGRCATVVNIDPRRVPSAEFRVRNEERIRLPGFSSLRTPHSEIRTWEVHIHGGRTPTGLEAVAWAREVVRLGAGEIVLTSMDADGTKNGYDLEMLRAVTAAVNVPVVASGGAGHPEHLRAAFEAGADATVVIGATAEEQTGAQRVALGGHARVGLEAPSVSWAQQRGYARSFPDCELIATDGLVEDVRRRKEPAEVARIRAACAIADEALAELLPTLADAPTEREFALALEFGMRRRGASAVSFDPIVAAGPNGSRPHARPSDRRIGRHELIVIDFGCIVDGYCSDMTRTVSVGEPSADAVHVWETVLAAQRAGRDVVRPGTDLAAVDLAARSVIDAAGFGASFAHGTGHGVGLEIHESPRVARTSSGTLASGDVVTVEPGVYLPGVGGVRIEDTLVVTEDAADALTEFPKQLVV